MAYRITTLWSPRSGIVCTRYLKTLAKCSSLNGSSDRKVALVLEDGAPGRTNLDACYSQYKSDEEKLAAYRQSSGYKWALRIDGTPGSWYLSTLLRESPIGPRIAIDMGQHWYCDNLDQLLQEALTLI